MARADFNGDASLNRARRKSWNLWAAI